MGNAACGVLLAAAAGLLAGCAGSVEDRINAAIPVSAEVAAAKAAFDASAKAMQADTTQLEADYAAQLKIRALECSRGQSPGLFASATSIRASIGNEDCFKAADAKLQQWLGLRRMGWLAGMPPLRPVPAKVAPILTGPDDLIQAAFADQAGVAVLRGRTGYAVVDLAGSEIRKADLPANLRAALSPNGRLLALSTDADAQVLDTESGEVLATIDGLRSPRIGFVGGKGLVYGQREGGIVYRDFASGAETPIAMNTSYVADVVQPSAKAERYLLIGQTRIGEIELRPDGQGFKPSLVREQPISAFSSWEDGTLVAHNALVYTDSSQLKRLDLANAGVTSVDLAPLRALRIVPTANPDVTLLSIIGGRGGSGLYVYSFSTGTLAKVDTSALLSQRIVYIPAANANALLDGAKLVLVDKLPTAAPEPLADVVHRIKFETQLAELEMMDRLQQMQSQQAGMPRPSSFRTSGASPYGDAMPARQIAPGQRFSEGEAGLSEAVRAGVLRLGGPGDIDRWKMAYMTRNRRSPGKTFDERIAHQQVYVVTGNMTLPSNLTGAHAVVFVVEQGVPLPQGNAGHSAVLDMGSGQCQGSICMMYLQ